LNPGYLDESKIYKSEFIAITLLNLGTLVWFFLLIFNMEDIFAAMVPSDPHWGQYWGNSLVYGFAIFWSIAISFIGGRINSRKLLSTSIMLGIFSTVLLAFLDGPFFALILSSLMGTSLGLCLPSSMALVADYTVVENRGRASGIIILGTFITAIASMIIYRILNLDLLGLILLLAVIRSISIFALLIEKFDRPSTINEKTTSLRIYKYKDFLFYLSPWLMFSIAAGLAWNLIPKTEYLSAVEIGNNLRYVLMGVFGLVAGVIADRFGRKQPIIIGLATFGIGFILLGYIPSGTSVIIYFILSGITWGSLFVVFLTVPGDLSTPSSREKFYALGNIVPLIGIFVIAAIPTSYITDILPENIVYQILGICLFLAMYPVFRAKETLTWSKIRDRKMKEYTEKVGKIIQETKEEK
jgi:MFS family permease